MDTGLQSNTADQMEALAKVSADYLQKVITGEQEASREVLTIARLASGSISNFIRHQSVKHNHERTVLRLADKLSGNPSEMLQYISAALPDAGFVRALKAPEPSPEPTPEPV